MRRIALSVLLLVSLSAFDLQGHRGARGLAPENTLPAFAKALELGVSTLELDTVVTRDGIVVITHDPVLNANIARGPDGNWLDAPGPVIHAVTLEELRRYDVGRLKPGSRYAQGFPDQVPVDGTRIAPLAELFDLVKRAGNATVRFNIETKLSPLKPEETLAPEPFARAVIAEIRKAGVTGRATLQSFDWRTLQVAQSEAPEIATVYLSAQQTWLDNIAVGKPGPSPWTAGFDIDDHGGSVPRLVKAAGGRIWSPFFGDLNAANHAEARALGLSIVPWTVNREEDMARVIALGVDGLITDRPDIARRVMAAQGLALPAPAKP